MSLAVFTSLTAPLAIHEIMSNFRSTALDDIMVELCPKSNVDYLLSWKIHDLWATLYYIRKTKKDLSSYYRLENAI
jgi:hypothetical protein